MFKNNKKTIICSIISVIIVMITSIMISSRIPAQKGSGLKELAIGIKNATLSTGISIGNLAKEAFGNANNFEKRLENANNSGENYMIKPNGSIIMLGDKSSKACGDELSFIYLMQKNEKILNTPENNVLKYYEEYYKDPASEETVKAQNCAGYKVVMFYGVFKLEDSENYQFIYFVGNDEDKLKEEIAGSQRYAPTVNVIVNTINDIGEMLTIEE